jgi:hypothetical protein
MSDNPPPKPRKPRKPRPPRPPKLKMLKVNFRLDWKDAAIQKMMVGDGGPVERHIFNVTMATERYAKENCPVDTGRLRGSIRSVLGTDNKGRFGLVGSDVDYALYVHRGTRAYTIKPKVKKALWWEGAAHPVMRVRIKERKARPFLNDALERALRER